jgi:hypothetical protein
MSIDNANSTANYEGINSTDACFIELNALGYRITGALNILLDSAARLPILKTEAGLYPELFKDKFLVKSMWEYLVLNLYKLLEIHDSILGKILKENDVLDLAKCLEPSWTPIKDIKVQLGLYRNAIAHSKDQANNFVSFMDLDPNYYQTQTKIIVAAHTAMFYISGIFENLPDLYSKSRIPLNLKIAKIKEWHPRDETSNAEQAAADILKQINENLVKSGFTAAHEMKYD